ncbi:hypothetical protein [Rhodoferax sp. U11-2br]|uniref:hypothetical protein n=1 Tax=Rhodoferax sp. U11-2br TaxID=2838878 RepID=UPI001BE5B221|nr:hypothetical protein [Rhodoferax sp. U11-2br]MBT3066724.1 hypothetical protein [Rhodoferax sp. U11-2br]
MEELLNRDIYGPQGALQIEEMGSIAVSIANRWQLGWPERVTALIKARVYLVNLDAQLERELDALADAVNLQHLTHSEILQVYGVSQDPPIWQHNALFPLPLFVTYGEDRTDAQRADEAALRKRQEAFTW